MLIWNNRVVFSEIDTYGTISKNNYKKTTKIIIEYSFFKYNFLFLNFWI